MKQIKNLSTEQRLSVYMIMFAEIDDQISENDRTGLEGYCSLLCDLFPDEYRTWRHVHLEYFTELYAYKPIEPLKMAYSELWFENTVEGWITRRAILLNCIEQIINEIYY